MLDAISILRQLVSTPSVNPMGQAVAGPTYGEARLTQLLAEIFAGLGIPCHLQDVGPGQQNVLAVLAGEVPPERGGKIVLLDAHQDTVPVAGMSIPPWEAELRQGRVYGRGACDTKGGMAAMLTALSRLADEPAAQRPTVVMSCLVNEEFGFTGVKALVQAWGSGDTAGSSVWLRRPDAVVVAEPTELNVVVAHQGVVRWQCHTLGRAAHSAQPEAGDNAIYKMARVLSALESRQHELTALALQDPAHGAGTLSVGVIQGGASVNTVPDRCTIDIDRRFPADSDAQSVREELIEYVARHAGLETGVAHDPPYLQTPGLSDKINRQLAGRLVATAAEVTGECRHIRVPYATQAAFFAAAGVPAVVFGPGSAAQAHTADEWIAVDQVHAAAEIYYRFIRASSSGVSEPHPA